MAAPVVREMSCRGETETGAVAELLAAADLPGLAAGHKRIVLKPNLVEALEPPITTPVWLVRAVAAFLRDHLPDATIIIAEGSGALDYSTSHSFAALGYDELAAGGGIELVDLNQAPCRHLRDAACRRWPEMHLPKLILDAFLISIPVLKAHTLAGVTLTMKNMMGAAPPAHYQQGGHWKKAAFHEDIHAAIFDLNRYRTPDFTLLDATVGMPVAHLWGPQCDPPVGKLVAGSDPVAVDAHGCALLGRDWREIGHIRMADGVLGRACPQVVPLS